MFLLSKVVGLNIVVQEWVFLFKKIVCLTPQNYEKNMSSINQIVFLKAAIVLHPITYGRLLQNGGNVPNVMFNHASDYSLRHFHGFECM